ncbi:MAG TPA: glutathione transferase [Kofleriaceae bacterium]
MADLTLYADQSWESPWAFHAMVALEELHVPYTLDPVRRPIAKDVGDRLRDRALLGKVPCLADGDFWLSESSAISEYLAETYAPPAYPRLLPADRQQRARARQVMSWLRTSLMGLREDRPTSSVFLHPVTNPLSDRAKRDIAELLGVTEKLLVGERTTLFDDWCIADADLALMLMRLVANSDPVPERVADYAMAQWQRPSIRKYLAHIPTSP